MSLAGLGLSADQERLYRYLLRRPHADPTRIRIELAMPDLPRVIGELRARGLVDHASAPVAPSVAPDRPGGGRARDARRGGGETRRPRPFALLTGVATVLTGVATVLNGVATALAGVAAGQPRGARLRTFRSPVDRRE